MATVTLPRGSASVHGSAVLYGRPTKTVYTIVDIVNAAAVKGSALAAVTLFRRLVFQPIPLLTRCIVAFLRLPTLLRLP